MGSLSPYGIDYLRIVDTGELIIDLVSTSPEPVVGQVLVVSEFAVQVLPLGQGTAVSVGAGESAVVALTARDVASYDLSVN
jgi:hypothetical protein